MYSVKYKLHCLCYWFEVQVPLFFSRRTNKLSLGLSQQNNAIRSPSLEIERSLFPSKLSPLNYSSEHKELNSRTLHLYLYPKTAFSLKTYKFQHSQSLNKHWIFCNKKQWRRNVFRTNNTVRFPSYHNSIFPLSKISITNSSLPSILSNPPPFADTPME